MKKYICIVLIIICLPVIAFSQQDIQFDISEMNETMAFSMLFQITMSPDFFLDTTIKINGRFLRDYSDFSGRYYNYVMVTDEAGCCQNGLEFLIANKENIESNYPSQNEEISIIGTLKMLEAGGYEYPYIEVQKVIYL